MNSGTGSATTIISSGDQGILSRKVLGIPVSLILMAGVLTLAALLRIVNLSAVGEGNQYYAAAVQSMLSSWSNFFFAAAEPGGSVTVDKPPLGLWIQTASAALFGVNTIGLMLPQILAGLGSVVVVYILVRRWFGEAAGILAALILAITPVTVAVERNNTMDALLIFTLLLAVWAFVQAAERGPGWLILGALLIGLAFNIKMLQAFLPVPAMFLYYFLAGKQHWLRKLVYILLAGFVILVVSFSWVVIVDSIPEENRPYIGSSENNTVMELVFGHNGLNRLLGKRGANELLSGGTAGYADDSNRYAQAPGQIPPGNQPAVRGGQNAAGQDAAGQDAAGQRLPGSGQQMLPQNQPGAQGAVPGRTDQPGMSAQDQLPPAGGTTPSDGFQGRSQGGQSGNQEIGESGLDRLFTLPLANEISWLLPLGLGMLLVLVFSSPLQYPIGRGWQTGVLWGGWLLTCVVFFSFAAFFHAYYLAMFAPPLAAVIAGGWARLRTIGRTRKWLASGILWLLALVTVVFQIWTAGLYSEKNGWAWAAALFLGSGIIIQFIGNLLSRSVRRDVLQRVGTVLIAAAVLAAPLAWSVQAVLEESPNTSLPGAYDGDMGLDGQRMVSNRRTGNGNGMGVDSNDLFMLEFLQENTQGMEYMLAVPSAMQGARYVLASGRPVLYLGGFNGGDPVMDLPEFRHMVLDGELRFVLDTGDTAQNANIEIYRWVRQICSRVEGASTGLAAGQGAGLILFDCGDAGR